MALMFSSSRSSYEDNYTQARAATLAHLRRESLDVYNRLHSIAEDISFVETVRRTYPDLPILRMPNL